MDFLIKQDPIFLAFSATLFCWFMTAAGSAAVFFFKKINVKISGTMLGFASGIMIAASFWSLLSPALDLAEGGAFPAYLVAAIGFTVGALFTLASDAALSHLQSERDIHPDRRKLSLLVGAITIHNIPEGLAVGVAFGALSKTDMTPAALAAAISVAIGIALQNFPEGAAVSIPMRETGVSRKRSFFFGQLSGMAEPISGVIGALLVSFIRPILPFALSFAAGAMIYVTVEELIPESRAGGRYLATLGCVAGFVIMMVMDVALS